MTRYKNNSYLFVFIHSEDLVKRTADAMVREGYLDAGYEYLVIDDCWTEFNRSADGKLVANKQRFPNGMKNLGDYVKIII